MIESDIPIWAAFRSGTSIILEGYGGPAIGKNKSEVLQTAREWEHIDIEIDLRQVKIVEIGKEQNA